MARGCNAELADKLETFRDATHHSLIHPLTHALVEWGFRVVSEVSGDVGVVARQLQQEVYESTELMPVWSMSLMMSVVRSCINIKAAGGSESGAAEQASDEDRQQIAASIEGHLCKELAVLIKGKDSGAVMEALKSFATDLRW